ncbi:MAG TPA: cupin domain-containing protein [Nocardioidaceae bacterium]|nr:cupin domain-containing protein [Nocardioidaceae bacterium]
MSTTAAVPAQDRRFCTEPATSEAWWFLDTMVVVRNPQGAPRLPLVMELIVPPGGSPPRHVHQGLHDAFFLLDGELVLSVGDETTVARPGTYAVVPAGSDHTFRVTSSTPARLLLIHDDDSFLRMIQAGGVPAEEHRLPAPGQVNLDLETLSRLVEEHDSHVVGRSMEEDEARVIVGPTQASLGAVNHVALGVTDLRRSERWYTETLGLVRIDGEIAQDGTGHVTLLSRSGGWVLALTSADAAGVGHVAFTCTDRAALVSWRETIAERGAAPGTITDAPYGSGFVTRDPDGLEVELFAPATA